MTKKQVYNLLVDISEFYPSLVATESKAIAWQSILYFVKEEDLLVALNKYVKNEHFPPTIASLLDYWKDNHYQKSTDKIGD